MRTDVMPSVVQMEPEVLKNLVREVKETVARNIPATETKKPSFGIADLWNIQRKAKRSGDFAGR